MAYSVPDNVTWKNVSSGVVLLNLESGEYYTLNESGSLIWTDLVESKPESDIIEHMAAEFDCDVGLAKTDFEEYLEYLIGEKLLNEAD
jgi:hypothetical protein